MVPQAGVLHIATQAKLSRLDLGDLCLGGDLDLEEEDERRRLSRSCLMNSSRAVRWRFPPLLMSSPRLSPPKRSPPPLPPFPLPRSSRRSSRRS
mmetsp:Transcript_74433/g.164407  ORF Transcript_74433/g.164407 Transcript_74433/m.164407 type:complete len:94 (+) Transcript_74433:221-502(+)